MFISMLSALNLVLSVVISSATEHSSSRVRTCRCVPNAWVGLLQSVEREFDLTENSVMIGENAIQIKYDYRHKIVSMHDLQTDSIVISDYQHRMRYFVSEGGCNGMRSPDAMVQMCVPDDASFVGEYEMGTGLSVEVWQYTNPDNITIRTTLSTATCMPVSEESTIVQDGYAGVTTNQYLNVDLEHTSDAIVKVPASCRHRSRHHSSHNALRQKRTVLNRLWKQGYQAH